MGDCKINGSCETKTPQNTKSNSCCGKIVDDIKHLADKAWGELLKEKIKKRYEDQMGAKMDEIASLAVDTAMECWNNKIEAQKLAKDHEDKLHHCIGKNNS